jgi:molybdopterin-guanine dinucleotide biosynthesis protein A
LVFAGHKSLTAKGGERGKIQSTFLEAEKQSGRNMLTLTAVLFVGGESRRMGSDKATLRLGGEPLWRRQLGLLQQLRPRTLLVSARARPHWCPEEVITVPDLSPPLGALSGLAAVLSVLSTSHLLAFAVDLPFMDAEHLTRLWSLAAEGRGLVPLKHGLFEPLCAFYPREAAAEAKAQLAHGEGTLQRLLLQLLEQGLMASYCVPDAEARLYHNMNTPEQVPVMNQLKER